MVLAPSIVYALVDALTGGLGVGETPAERTVSDIEESLLHKPHIDVLRDLESAWKPWFPLSVEHVRCDRVVQVMSTIPDEEVCHVGTINVAGDVLSPAPLHFVFPYTSMEPLLEATSSRIGDESDPNWRANLVQNLRDSRARVSVSLGETRLSARRIRSLAPGELIELGRRVDEEVDVLVEGQEVFKARIGQSHRCYAARITSRREPLGALQDRSTGQILLRKGLITREQLAVALVDERMNRRDLLDSISSRGWVERRVLEAALRA
jgi:flagellar motor switch protein FliM